MTLRDPWPRLQPAVSVHSCMNTYLVICLHTATSVCQMHTTGHRTAVTGLRIKGPELASDSITTRAPWD